MSETSGEQQTGVKKDGKEQAGSAAANPRPPGGRSLQAGGEFLKALASDLAAIVSRLRLPLIARKPRTLPPGASAPSHISPGPTTGHVLWRRSITLLGFGAICAGALCAVMLSVLFGFALEMRRSESGASGLRLEAAKGESLGHTGPRITEASQKDVGRGSGAQVRPGDCIYQPFDPRRLCESSGSSVDDAQQRQATNGTPAISTNSPDSSTQMRCNVDLCAATYKSFIAADCSYQPYGGGARRLCERGASSADPTPSTAPSRVGQQCNVDLCAATYKSFNAADCTYQPYNGGPRRICER